MKEVPLNSWEEFKDEVRQLYVQHKKYADTAKSKGTLLFCEYPLFRGQKNSEWGLKSTLERTSNIKSEHEYYRKALIAYHEVKTCLSQTSIPDFNIDLSKIDNPIMFTPKGYEFLSFLRHAEFPSPLLDWTRSANIAAFFAFNELDTDKPDRVAIFSYVDDTGKGKPCDSNDAAIVSIGHTIHSHKRHYLQQSEYTLCRRGDDDDLEYANYDEFKRDDQEIITKYTLPSSEQKKVLEELSPTNINAYALFGSDEGLMHSIAVKEFIL